MYQPAFFMILVSASRRDSDMQNSRGFESGKELKAMKGQFQGHDERNSRCPCNDRIVLLETYPAAYKTRGEKDPTELDILDVECGLENQNGFENAMRFCSLEAQNQMTTLQKQLMFSASVSDCQIPRTIIKSLKDCRKSLGEQTGRALFQKYVESLQNGAPTCMELKVLPYLQECIQLGWWMCVQDPPVVISPDVTHGVNFDTDFYKAYTKSGPLVDYVVWPALCLHEKGPLLCKGIAQGSGGKKEV
ncbi:hypothetical protein MAR_024028 [Mya arenaria]|uniref:Mitochondria-eating protein C-terminal domain-containing protein n=1 Tax=Mya arenaria TaxID=6604 RepID=A0ABY7DTI0_MYAAR|nr:hypothetical protein MAR_024028 [Mya arenaria]